MLYQRHPKDQCNHISDHVNTYWYFLLVLRALTLYILSIISFGFVNDPCIHIFDAIEDIRISGPG
jgi:hypothetical protein